MICGIIQSSYIPWRGYFDIIHDCDVFIFHDDIQYTKQDFRNRNRIKTQTGLKWLTIPVGRVPTQTLIQDVHISDSNWSSQHLKLIENNYHQSPFFGDYFNILKSIYQHPWEKLAELNQVLIIEISKILGITTKFYRSSEFNITGKKTDRIIALCEKLGANHYISGPSAKVYLDENKLAQKEIALTYKKYEYPHYPQLYGTFEPQVSVIDLLFNCGNDAPKMIWNQFK